jgi:hypothetical protein
MSIEHQKILQIWRQYKSLGGGLKWHFRNRQSWKLGRERKGDANVEGILITTLFPAIKSLYGKIVGGRLVEEHGKPIIAAF